jgi:hypothetical protein
MNRKRDKDQQTTGCKGPREKKSRKQMPGRVRNQSIVTDVKEKPSIRSTIPHEEVGAKVGCYQRAAQWWGAGDPDSGYFYVPH